MSQFLSSQAGRIRRLSFRFSLGHFLAVNFLHLRDHLLASYPLFFHRVELQVKSAAVNAARAAAYAARISSSLYSRAFGLPSFGWSAMVRLFG